MAAATLTLVDWEQRLVADPLHGLLPEETARRLAQSGPNALTKAKLATP